GLEVRRVVRPRGAVGRRLLFPGPVARGVTDRAVVRDAGEADELLREADGQLLALLPEDAERAVAARSRQVLREHPREHDEDPVRDTRAALGADRAVLEAGIRGAERRLGLLAEE